MSYVRDKGIDYVVVNTRFYLHSLIGLKFARQLGVRPVLVEHGSAHLTMGGGAIDRIVAAYEHAVTRLVKRANPAVYAVSSAGCRWLRHFDIEALGVLNNSIDADLFRSMSSGRDFRGELGLGESTLLVSSIGRLVPEKGVTCILRPRVRCVTPMSASCLRAMVPCAPRWKGAAARTSLTSDA